MNKEKIAFVVVRYGIEVNGGAEYHCRMLAERLVCSYDVEVLTTCVKNYISGDNEYASGQEVVNQVLIRRFMTDPGNREMYPQYMKKANPAKRIRRFLYQCHLLKFISRYCPIWNYRAEFELKALNSQLFYSSTLFSFIQQHKDDYKAIIAISLDFPPMYYTALYAPEKTILIPTMHYHGAAFRSILTSVFSRVAYIGFNTEAEQRLGVGIMGHSIARNGIISVGIEQPEQGDWEDVRAKFTLPADYLLYVGRVDGTKLNHVVNYFLAYKKKYKESALKFVLVGGQFGQTVEHPDIVYTGFVTDSEKMTIIQNAKVVINPSRYESLSLILLEAMSLGKPMLVNGRCSVLKEHCIKSNYASLYYLHKRGFIAKLHLMATSDDLRAQMGEKGRRYVAENYDWEVILLRLKKVIELI